VGARAIEVDADRFTMAYVIVSEAFGETAAEGGGVIVAYDYASGRKAMLPADVRMRIADLEHTADTGQEAK
jgi:acyl-CoA thioester hydrolase